MTGLIPARRHPREPMWALELPESWRMIDRTSDSALVEPVAALPIGDVHRQSLITALRAGLRIAWGAHLEALVFSTAQAATGSFVAVRRVKPAPGATLGDDARRLVANGATAPDPHRRVLCWSTERVLRDPDRPDHESGVVLHESHHLTPVPGTDHTRALQWTAVAMDRIDAPEIGRARLRAVERVARTLHWAA